MQTSRNVTGSKGTTAPRRRQTPTSSQAWTATTSSSALDGNDYLDACGSDGVGLGATRTQHPHRRPRRRHSPGAKRDILIGGYFLNNLDSNDASSALMDVWKGTGDYYSRANALQPQRRDLQGERQQHSARRRRTDVFYGYSGKHWYWVGGDDAETHRRVEYKNDLTL